MRNVFAFSFKNDDNFNFAFDLVDALADKEPQKLAMLHISQDKTERRFTFKDIKKASNQVANYFKSLGIKKGDIVTIMSMHTPETLVAIYAPPIHLKAIPSDVSTLYSPRIRTPVISASVSIN